MASKSLRLLNSRNPSKAFPILGLGCWQAKAGEVENAVETALKLGYKHIDSAAIYRNEKEVGEGIKRSGVKRDEIWITSKVSIFKFIVQRLDIQLACIRNPAMEQQPLSCPRRSST